jgi:hypothetical protein
MNCYPMAAMERTMKIQEVILRGLAKSITSWQAAEIIGIADRQMRCWHYRYKGGRCFISEVRLRSSLQSPHDVIRVTPFDHNVHHQRVFGSQQLMAV